jgi:hypothetical protein
MCAGCAQPATSPSIRKHLFDWVRNSTTQIPNALHPDGYPRKNKRNLLLFGGRRVEYLIEVCDPCQASCLAYSVNSVMVSDFYTPQYFDPVKSNGVRYSYSGQVRGPREVLDGGYLSWFDPQTRHLFQLQVDGTKTIVDKGEVPFAAESLRAFSDRVSADRRDAVIKGGSRAGLLLNAATDYRKTARVKKPKLTAVDHAQLAHARNLRAQLERIAAAEVKSFSQGRSQE